VTVSIEVTPTRYDDPVAVALTAAVQQEYVVRYGGPDETPMDPADFRPPRGLFLVARLDGVPAGCGGWRALGVASVEVKRMFTVDALRGKGVARAVLAELERTAAAVGHTRVVLETGRVQPEAIGLYTSSGYEPIAPFGYYADAPSAVHLGKALS
jgi:GNAT superfamily N-acetyltransferase